VQDAFTALEGLMHAKLVIIAIVRAMITMLYCFEGRNKCDLGHASATNHEQPTLLHTYLAGEEEMSIREEVCAQVLMQF